MENNVFYLLLQTSIKPWYFITKWSDF